jgi:hypothetical protein
MASFLQKIENGKIYHFLKNHVNNLIGHLNKATIDVIKDMIKVLIFGALLLKLYITDNIGKLLWK